LNRAYAFYEFFAGGGMVRAGLGKQWRCTFANDFDRKKSGAYRANWGDAELRTADIRTITVADLPGRAELAWASFPCQDLSLAGCGAGLKGDRSGTFWPFWRLIKELESSSRAPLIIALENVCGALTSHGGNDFVAICDAFRDAQYNFGALVIDAALFVPQSRPRLFLIATHTSLPIPEALAKDSPSALWHTGSLRTAYSKLPATSKQRWVWWNLPLPATRESQLSDLIEQDLQCAAWFAIADTARLLTLMSDVNKAKVASAVAQGCRIVGAVYKRTRRDQFGQKVQRAEIRLDGLSGCLRTPAGGSSRQILLLIDGATMRARLVSARETARLMGLPDSYKLPGNYNEAYHLAGDGVVVPVVRHLAAHIFEPLLHRREADKFPRKI
jgi:DNA (cytosine-5)-methyltransferase 1